MQSGLIDEIQEKEVIREEDRQRAESVVQVAQLKNDFSWSWHKIISTTKKHSKKTIPSFSGQKGGNVQQFTNYQQKLRISLRLVGNKFMGLLLFLRRIFVAHLHKSLYLGNRGEMAVNQRKEIFSPQLKKRGITQMA